MTRRSSCSAFQLPARGPSYFFSLNPAGMATSSALTVVPIDNVSEVVVRTTLRGLAGPPATRRASMPPIPPADAGAGAAFICSALFTLSKTEVVASGVPDELLRLAGHAFHEAAQSRHHHRGRVELLRVERLTVDRP